MTTFVKTIMSGLILALVSGLVFIAYKHPKGYRFIAKYYLSSLLIPSFVYCVAKIAGIYFYIRYFGEEADSATANDVEIVEISVSLIQTLNQYLTNLIWVSGITFVYILFVAFLLILPIILSADETSETDATQNDA